jgi:hypothetical protein
MGGYCIAHLKVLTKTFRWTELYIAQKSCVNIDGVSVYM